MSFDPVKIVVAPELKQFAYDTRSPLVLIRGSTTAQWNVHDILQPHVLPLRQRFSGALFQQYNVRPHMARGSQDCLRTVTALTWPARSPDLSPIKHFWDHLRWPSWASHEFERIRGPAERERSASPVLYVRRGYARMGSVEFPC
ncbi:transposable element Tcb2 transposase [Trichonephila clavipes]|nr:transposable element Tcb2 transposase [Trichonephila clavipes]